MLIREFTEVSGKSASASICDTPENAVTFVVNQKDFGKNKIKINLKRSAQRSTLPTSTTIGETVAGDTSPTIEFTPKYQPYLKRGDLVCCSLKASAGLTPANDCLASYSFYKDIQGNYIVWGVSSVTAQDGILNTPSIVDASNLTSSTVATIFQK